MIKGQNIIQGKVTSTDGMPLAGANIFLFELQRGTESAADGSYSLTGLPKGKLKIQFSYLGHAGEIRTVSLDNTAVQLDVVLHPAPIETQEIVISGGYNAAQHENAVKIDVLKLDKTDLRLSPDLMEVVTRVPGVDMISKGNGISKPVIRGLSMDNVLTLNNSVRNENYQYSDHHPLGIDEYGIEEVEVILGPASLLYGSDAIGGVINFLKERPAPVGTIEGDYHLKLFSNTLGYNSNLGMKGSTGKFFGGIRYGMASHADFLQGGGAFVPNTRFNTNALKINAGYTGSRGMAALYYDHSNMQLGLAEDDAIESISERGRKNEVWYQQFNNHLLSSRNKLFLNRYKLELNAAFQSVELIHFAEKDVTEIDMMLSTLTYEARLYLPSDEGSEYILGLQGFFQDNSNVSGAEEILLPDANTMSYSAFGLIQKTLLQKMKLQAGLRYDVRSLDTEATGVEGDDEFRASLAREYGNISGSAGMTYSPVNDLLVRANFAAAYRTPNLAELTSRGMHELRYELGDANLKPQYARETDLNLHYHVDNITLDITGFLNIIDNYIHIAPSGDTVAGGNEIFRYTQQNATLTGLEVLLHYHPASLPWLHFETSFSSVTGKQKNGDHLPFIPANKLEAEVEVSKDQLGFFRDTYLRISTSSAFRQYHPAPEEEPAAGYTLLNLAAGGGLTMGRHVLYLQLHVNNLLDHKYIDHLSTLRETGFYNPGRNVAISLRVPFSVVRSR